MQSIIGLQIDYDNIYANNDWSSLIDGFPNDTPFRARTFSLSELLVIKYWLMNLVFLSNIKTSIMFADVSCEMKSQPTYYMTGKEAFNMLRKHQNMLAVLLNGKQPSTKFNDTLRLITTWDWAEVIKG